MVATDAGKSVDPARLHEHASHLDVLRSRLEQVRTTAEQIGHDPSAFGLQCGGNLSALAARHVRNQELIAYVEESLVGIVQGLHEVADGRQQLAELAGMPRNGEDLTHALIDDGTEPAGHTMNGLTGTVGRREWVEPQLADAAPVVEFATPADHMFDALRAGGLASAMACVEPLQRMLDDLTGTPDVVAVQATCWGVTAIELRSVGADLRTCLVRDFTRLDRPDVAAYLSLMSNNVQGLIQLAEIADGLGLITQSAGDLILLTRDIVRGLIGDLFARVIVWIADTSTVVALPVMAVRLATVVATCWRIHVYISALTTSMANLSRYIEG
jgi:hypothetical protein